MSKKSCFERSVFGEYPLRLSAIFVSICILKLLHLGLSSASTQKICQKNYKMLNIFPKDTVPNSPFEIAILRSLDYCFLMNYLFLNWVAITFQKLLSELGYSQNTTFILKFFLPCSTNDGFVFTPSNCM